MTVDDMARQPSSIEVGLLACETAEGRLLGRRFLYRLVPRLRVGVDLLELRAA